MKDIANKNQTDKPDLVKVEAFIPRTALAATAAAEWVSQRTSEAVFGIGRRPFLESLPRYPGKIVRQGKLRLVKRVEYSTWLESQAVAKPEPPPAPTRELDPIEQLAVAAGGRVAT